MNPAESGPQSGGGSAVRWRWRGLPWWAAVAILLALQGVAGVFLPRLQINNAPEQYYPAGSPGIELRDALRRDFPSDEVLTLLFHGGDLFEPATLARVERLRESLSRQPLVDRVFAITAHDQIRATTDGFEVRKVVDLESGNRAKVEQVREGVLADRFAPGMLVSRDGRYLAVMVRPKPLSDSLQRKQVRAAALAAIDEVGLRDHFKGDAGPLTLDVVQLESMLADTVVFVPLTVTLGILLMWWLVGAVRPVIVGVVAMSSVTGPAVALIAAIGAPYTMVAAILPSLLSAYTTATLMHLYAPVQAAQAAGSGNAKAVADAVSETIKPGLLNVLTTSAGLLSLVLVPIPPIQVFGIAGAAGTALVFVVVYLLVPPLLSRWDRKPWPTRSSGLQVLARISTRITSFSMRHPMLVLTSAGVAVVACTPLAIKVQVESNLLAYFAADHPVNEVTRQVDHRLSGVTVLEVSLLGAGRDSLQNVGVLRAMKDLQSWLERQSEVDRTLSVADLVEEMHWAMNGEKVGFRTLPPNDRLLRQYLLIYDGNDLHELVNRDYQRARILVNLNTHGTREIADVLARIRGRLSESPIPGVTVDVGGHGRLFADQADLLVSGQIKSFAGAFGQIFVLMVLIWRSVGSAVVGMVPNVAPLFFVFVLMGLFGLPLDMATVMIASLILGITVDDTIHLFHGYRERLAAGASPVVAVARTFRVSGRAVMAVSILLVSQFALLGMSSFLPTSNFGRMTAVGLLSGQVLELLLLPPLLMWLAGHRKAPVAAGSRRRASVPDDEAETVFAQVTTPGLAEEVPRPQAPRASDERGASAMVQVMFCNGEACRQHGAAELWRHAKRADRLGLVGRAGELNLSRTECLGLCESAPVVLRCSVDSMKVHSRVAPTAAGAAAAVKSG